MRVIQDDLFEEGKRTLLTAFDVSVSTLQARMKLSYTRARSLMFALEDAGIVSVPDSTGRRVLTARYAMLAVEPARLRRKYQVGDKKAYVRRVYATARHFHEVCNGHRSDSDRLVDRIKPLPNASTEVLRKLLLQDTLRLTRASMLDAAIVLDHWIAQHIGAPGYAGDIAPDLRVLAGTRESSPNED